MLHVSTGNQLDVCTDIEGNFFLFPHGGEYIPVQDPGTLHRILGEMIEDEERRINKELLDKVHEEITDPELKKFFMDVIERWELNNQ